MASSGSDQNPPPGTGPPAAPAPAEDVARKARRKRIIRIVQIALSLAIAVAIFVFIIPKFASYRDVWAALRDMTPLEIGSLLAVTAFNIFSYWLQMTAALPGLTLRQAAVNNQSSTAVANTIPAGGLIALGVTYAQLRSWGFRDSEIALMIEATGIWNVFIKLVLPPVAVVLLLVSGGYQQRFLIPSVIGLVVLGALVGAGALMLWRDSFARGIGGAAGKIASVGLKLFRRPAVHWSEAGLRFRNQTRSLIKLHWLSLSATTVISHVALFLVLLTALRHVGVSEQEISTVQVFAVFCFVRLLGAVPLTPGGVGIVDVAYISALVLAASGKYPAAEKELFRTQVAAAVLVFRTLTYAVQIPFGALAYLYWLKNKSWRKPVPRETAEAAPASG